MPSINEVIERVNRARPDAIDDETKAAWLLELDGELEKLSAALEEKTERWVYLTELAEQIAAQGK